MPKANPTAASSTASPNQRPIGKSTDPTLKDFYHDMNRHGGAVYNRVGGRYVVERDNFAGKFYHVTVWEAVIAGHGDEFAKPSVDGNRYAWDALARSTHETDESATEMFEKLTTAGRVRNFAERFPYGGPRASYDQRNGLLTDDEGDEPDTVEWEVGMSKAEYLDRLADDLSEEDDDADADEPTPVIEEVDADESP